MESPQNSNIPIGGFGFPCGVADGHSNLPGEGRKARKLSALPVRIVHLLETLRGFEESTVR